MYEKEYSIIEKKIRTALAGDIEPSTPQDDQNTAEQTSNNNTDT